MSPLGAQLMAPRSARLWGASSTIASRNPVQLRISARCRRIVTPSQGYRRQVAAGAYQCVEKVRFCLFFQAGDCNRYDRAALFLSQDYDGQADHEGVLIGPYQRKVGVGPALRGAMAGLEPHEQAEIETGHVEDIALLDVLPPSEPDPAHAAAPVQGVLETSLNHFRSLFSHGLPDPRRYPSAVVVHGAWGLMVAPPIVQALALGFGDS